MLTPAFDLTQTEEFLIVAIQAPYAKASEVEIHFDDYDFMFFSKPYYLRLNLPGKVLFQEEPSVKYDFDKRTFTIQAPKAQIGEVFEGLDMITLLLAPNKRNTNATPSIEVIESSGDVEDEEEDFDWNLDQVASEDKFGYLSLTGQQCGFANTYTFTIFNLKEEIAEIMDVKEPQYKTPDHRSKERVESENNRFSEDHYIADLYEDNEIQGLLKYTPEWDTLTEEIKNNPALSPDDKFQFTADEKERLRKLPCNEYLLDKGQIKSTFLGLIDILFAYAYNKRTTEGENTVESAWTINKLSATLCWLEVYSSISQVTIACIRRSLTYPLYRHFELSLTVLEDVQKIIMLGRKYIIKCLLDIHEIFCKSDPRYLLNELFITDYIVWMQTKTCSTAKLVPLAEALEKVLLTKGDIGLNLVDIESFAKVAWMTKDNQFDSNPGQASTVQRNSASCAKSESSVNIDNDLSSTLQQLSIDSKSKIGKIVSATSSSESDSDSEVCSSESSDDSSSDSDTESSSGTESSGSYDTSSSSDNIYNEKRQLLRGAAIEDTD